MKTAEELFVKYKKANWEHEYAEGYPCGVTNYKDFNKALTEHDNEIKQLIDEMDVDEAVKEYLVKVGSVDRTDIIAFDYRAGIEFALTELKSNIGEWNGRIWWNCG